MCNHRWAKCVHRDYTDCCKLPCEMDDMATERGGGTKHVVEWLMIKQQISSIFSSLPPSLSMSRQNKHKRNNISSGFSFFSIRIEYFFWNLKLLQVQDCLVLDYIMLSSERKHEIYLSRISCFLIVLSFVSHYDLLKKKKPHTVSLPC